MLFKAFDKDMVKNYLNKLKYRGGEEDEHRIRDVIKRKITADMDLNVKSEMYAVKNTNETIKKDAEVIKRKLEL